MAGFKQTILSHQPKFFLTFDGDPFDPATRTLTSEPQVFIDESGYGSNIMLHNESDAFPAYRMGIPSLVDLEQTDQASLSFGWYGYQPAAPTRWPKAFIEVQHQAHLALDDNYGSYTVGFFVNKVEDEDTWRNIERDLGNSHYTNTLNKRWIRKQGAFDFVFRDYWSGSIDEELRWTHPGGTLTWEVPTWFYNKRHFIVLTWSVEEIESDVYLNTATFYINGHVYGSWTSTTSGSHPSSGSSAPIEIGGIINNASNFEDRATSNTQLDQIFILNKALTGDEVCRLYRKSKTYDNISVLAQAASYWPMADVEDPASTTMTDLIGSWNGTYIGGTTRYARQQAAPTQILGGSSVYFHNGGMAAVHRTGSGNLYNPVFTLGGDYTIDFWVNFSNSERSVLFSAQRDDFPHAGILIEANRRNNINQPGHIQFSISSLYQVSTLQFNDNGDPYNFNDGRFHHIAAVRKDANIYLWVDGVLHGSVTAPAQSISAPGPGQIYFMGSMPGNLNTTGFLSSAGIYGYALDDAEIRMRNAYSLIYRIQGTVTLQGNPHQATVRAYHHRTGKLAQEILSDSTTGDYRITLYDNSLIDLMVLNKQDPNIRYRVYGPIAPALYEDMP